MRARLLEIRYGVDVVPVFALEMEDSTGKDRGFLLELCGYGFKPHEKPKIVMGILAGGVSTPDPAAWDDEMGQTAHKYVIEKFDELVDGDVIDVDHILGRREDRRRSARMEEEFKS